MPLTETQCDQLLNMRSTMVELGLISSPAAHITDAKAAHSATTDTDTAAHLKTALDNMAGTVNAVIKVLEDAGLVATS